MIYGNKLININESSNTQISILNENNLVDIIKKVFEKIINMFKELWNKLQSLFKKSDYSDGYARMSEKEFKEWAKNKFGDDWKSQHNNQYNYDEYDDSNNSGPKVYSMNNNDESKINSVLQKEKDIIQFLNNTPNKDHEKGNEALKYSEDISNRSVLSSKSSSDIKNYSDYQKVIKDTEKLKEYKKVLLKKINIVHPDKYESIKNQKIEESKKNPDNTELKKNADDCLKDAERIANYCKCLNKIRDSIDKGIKSNTEILNRMKAEFDHINNWKEGENK